MVTSRDESIFESVHLLVHTDLEVASFFVIYPAPPDTPE
jgi:hypothetical protein